MFVSVIHHISDPDRFAEMMRNATIPDGLHVAQFTAGADRSIAICLWEVPSVQDVRNYLEPLTAGIGTNDYVEVDATRSLGLPAATIA
jgi:hypothetical protein